MLAGIITNSLLPNVKYKLIVFDTNGNYVKEQDYTATNESFISTAMRLNGGTYTFIAYSSNSTTNLPTLNFVNPAAKKLSEASISTSNTEDLLYYRSPNHVIVGGSSPNVLNNTFKHSFVNILTEVDASNTEYEIVSLNAAVGPVYPSAKINLIDGSITSTTTTSTNVPLTFSTLGGTSGKTTSSVIRVNPKIGSVSGYPFLTISNFKVGPKAVTANISPFSNVDLKSGYQYKLKVTLMPKDSLFIYKNQKVARINGTIWMRLNLGAPELSKSLSSQNPDANPLTSSQHGDYFQWGRKYPFVSGIASYTSNPTRNSGGYIPWSGLTSDYAVGT